MLRYIEICFEDSPKIGQFLDQTQVLSKIIGKLEHIYWFIHGKTNNECRKTVADSYQIVCEPFPDTSEAFRDQFYGLLSFFAKVTIQLGTPTLNAIARHYYNINTGSL